MSLFVVKHQHPAEQCPARDPQMGRMLLERISPENARAHGMSIYGDAVVDDSHTMYIIIDGPDRQAVERFFAPFAQMGAVEVMASSSCEAVVDRGGCEAPKTA